MILKRLQVTYNVKRQRVRESPLVERSVFIKILQARLPGHAVMTIFKSQGEEWKKVVVCFEIHQRLDDASRVVALTRATERCRVYVPKAWRDDGMPKGKSRTTPTPVLP